MNKGRLLFFLTAIILLSAFKLYIAQGLGHILLWPDECAYGTDWSLTNLSIYSIIPFLFGRYGGIAANCIITSACIIPLFYLFRKHKGEMEAAMFAALVSFAGPLWEYSLMNVTEPTFFLILLATLATDYSWLPIIAKPLGITAFLAKHKEHGAYAAVILGLAYWGNEGFLNGGGNPGLAVLRSIAYILVASLGTCLIPLKRIWDKQGDKLDELFLWLVICTFAILIPMTVYLPTIYFYGRYFDGIVLFALTFAYKPFGKDKKALAAYAFIVFAAFALFAFLPQGYSSIVGDAGLAYPGDIITKLLYASNYPIWKPCLQ